MEFLSVLKEVVTSFLPYFCVMCSKQGTMLCERCAQQLRLLSPHCVVCQQYSPKGRTCAGCFERVSISSAIIPFGYGKAIKSLFSVYKYNRAFSYIKVIDELLQTYSSIDPFLLFSQFERDKEVVLLPVPMHKKKLHERGFSPAYQIAEILRDILHKRGLKAEIHPRLVTKEKLTEKQAGKTKDQRLLNQQNVFSVNQAALRTEIAAERKLVIVDDVISTGATVFSLAEELQKHTTNKLELKLFAFARG